MQFLNKVFKNKIVSLRINLKNLEVLKK